MKTYATRQGSATVLAAMIAMVAPLACGGTGTVTRGAGGAGAGGDTSGNSGGAAATGGASGAGGAVGGAGGAVGGASGSGGVSSCSAESDATFCTRLGKACGSVTANDNCGKSRSVAYCGTCTAPATCSATNTCSCSAETSPELCSRLGRNCGSVTAPDNCGASRTVSSCGTCTAPDVCSAGNVCGPVNCVAETDTAFCTRVKKSCGAVTGTDNCGASRTVASCGTCAAPATCGATNVCSCTPEDSATFCSRLGKACGSVTANDNCGASRTVTSCGPCTAPQTCSASNVCTCVAETDTAFCSRLGKNCGTVTGTDNCAAARTNVSCGSCLAPSTCGGGGAANVCGGGGMVDVIQTSRNANAGQPEHCAAKPMLAPVAAGATTKTLITVDPNTVRQTIFGFGTSMTECAASTVMVLPAAQQKEIWDALFSPTGNNFTLLRTTIGSSDFSMSQYSYDDTPGDTALANFSIAKDKTYVIPGVKAAIASAGGAANLKVFSSPWSAPAWMKDSNNMQGGTLLASNYGIWANYFVKFIQAYKAEGIDIWGITTQNEATFSQANVREAMGWSAGSMSTFVKNNLGPALRAANLTPQVMFYDHNHGPAGSDAHNWAQTMYGDATTAGFVHGEALHWYGSSWQVNAGGLDAIHAVNPNKYIMFTEGTADGFIFGPTKNVINTAPWWQKDDWFWTKVNYDWGYDYAPGAAHVAYHSVYRYARDMIVGLNHWYTGWVDWNAVLNKFGAQEAAGGGWGTVGQYGVSHIRNGVPTPIMVEEGNPAAATIYYTPIYYTMRHFSKYIKPGAKILLTTVAPAAGVTATDYDNAALPDGVAMYAVGARNPDGSTAVVVFNQTNKAIDYTMKVGTRQVDTTAPAQSLQTLLWN